MQLRYTWEPYVQYGKRMELDKDTFIYRQQEKGRGFYYLSEGLICNTIVSSEGDEHVINYITEGMLFGEPGIQHQPYITSAYAVRPSIIHYFSNQTFQEICHTFPEAQFIFTKALLYKHRTLTEMIRFMDGSVEQKIAYFTIKLDYDIGEMIPFTQTNFAHFISISRKSVNQVINKWEKEGIIRINGDKLEILDKMRLKKLRSLNMELSHNTDYLLFLHKEFTKYRL